MATFIKPPEPLIVDGSNPSHAWNKWKQKFDIYLKASGNSKKDDEIKVGLLLNCIGDSSIDIYTNFKFKAAGPNPDNEEEEIPAEDPNDHTVVMNKFDDHFSRRDPQLMLRQRFWLHLQREPGQSFDSWVTTVKERAAECKFPQEFQEEAVRDKLTFSCTNDGYKLKLYDEGAKLSLTKATRILALKEATSQELQRSKTASIDQVQPRQKARPATQWKTKKQYTYNKPARPQTNDGKCQKCGYCGKSHPHGKQNCPAKSATCNACGKTGHYKVVCRSTANRPSRVNQIDDEHPLLIGGVSVRQVNRSQSNDAHKQPGWHIKLRAADQELSWCIDTGAQVSVMPSREYQNRYGEMSPTDKTLVGTGDTPLLTLGFADMKLKHGNSEIKERVYIVENATTLLLGVPAIRNLGLIHEIPGTYSIKAVDVKSPVTKEKVKEEYPGLFRGLGKLDGEYTIQLEEGTKPFCLTTPRRIALPLLEKTKAELERMVQLQVIEPIDEPTDWCAPIVVVPKQNGDVRICVDLTKLNRSVRRERYHMPKVEETLGKVASGTVFSKLDANSGFHQVMLSPESTKLTTFITPFGRYLFKRLPYGISSAPEYFQKKMDKELRDLEGVVCHMDDILITGSNQTEHDHRLNAVLKRLDKSGLTLNSEKCKFSQTKLDYLGQMIDGEGLRKDPRKIEAIMKMQPPTNVTELRQFLGMVNQQMKFVPNLAETTKPLRDLLKKEQDWVWDPAQQETFVKLQNELSSDRVLKLYSTTKETVVSADASSFGLGAVLLQKQENGELRPVAYASRSMTGTERRYAQIEKEALATTWSLEHWADLLVGLKFRVQTDHKPLVPLFSTKNIDELPIRVQRFRMRLMRFNFDIHHVPGKLLYTADALSRSPRYKEQRGKEDIDREERLRNEVECFVNSVMVTLPASDKRLEEIRSELRKDDTMKMVMYHVQEGWNEKSEASGYLHSYWKERGSLSVHEGLLLKSKRLVIPPKLRTQILCYLHDSHQGITKTRANAMSSVWWPGISRDIEKVVRNCEMCARYRKSQVEPMRGTEFPKRPWSRVGTDFFHYKGHNYLLAVDYYSRDVEVCMVTKNVDTKETVARLKQIFSRQGIPEILFSDNGPQYSSGEFKAFAQSWGFEHITASPHFPQSNGEAERAVQTIKSFMNKCDDEYLAMLQYRNTPLQNGYSPAQLNMSRRLKTRVPCHPEELQPKLPDQTVLKQREDRYRQEMKRNYDNRHRVRDAEELSPGDRVWIPDLKRHGTVTKHHNAPRSVYIDTDGRTVRRNRRMTRKLPNNDVMMQERSNDRDGDVKENQAPTNHDHSSDAGMPTEAETHNNPEPPKASTSPNTRPQRNRRRPRYLDDYVTP